MRAALLRAGWRSPRFNPEAVRDARKNRKGIRCSAAGRRCANEQSSRRRKKIEIRELWILREEAVRINCDSREASLLQCKANACMRPVAHFKSACSGLAEAALELLHDAEQAESVGKLDQTDSAGPQGARNLLKNSAHFRFVKVLQHAIGKNKIDAARLKWQVFGVAANEIRARAKLLRNVRSGGQRVNVHVSADWDEASARGGDAPTSPTATDVDHDLAFAGAEWPVWNWIAGKPAARAPVQISIRVHDPIVHKRIDLFALRCSVRAVAGMRTRAHVERNGFAAGIFRENRNTIFEGELMRAFADQGAVLDAEFGVVVGARENPEQSVVE